MALRQLTPEESARLSTARSKVGSSPFDTRESISVSKPQIAQNPVDTVPKAYNSPPQVNVGTSQSLPKSQTAAQAKTVMDGGVPETYATPKPSEVAPTAPTPTAPAEIPGQTMNAPTAPGQLPKPAQEPIPTATTPSAEPTKQETGLEGIAAGTQAAAEGMRGAAGEYLSIGQQMAQESFDVAENARRLDTISALNGTNARDIASQLGVSLENMTMAQLEQLAVNSGLTPDPAVMDRIRQEGADAIDSIRMEKGDLLAENKFQGMQLERSLGRALDDRERFNASQDTKLRNSLAVFGGGSASQGGNMSVMQAREQGQRALEDLQIQFAGRSDALSRQANAIIREYGAKEREINNQVSNAIESKYAELQTQMKELRAMGVTNKKDLQSALMPLMKEYVGLYNDSTKWESEQLFKIQQEMNDETEKLFRRSLDEDKMLSEQTGILFQNGQPVIDPTTGQPVSTFEAQKFTTTEGRLERAMEMEREQFNARLGFDVSKEEFNQIMEQARFTQGVDEFNATMGLNLSKFEYEQLKDSIDRNITMADKGLQYQTGVDMAPTSSFNPAKSKYGVTSADGGININAPVRNGKLVSTRRQCGMYVNDVIGIPGYFGDSFESKKARVTTQTPSPGSAFVIDVPGFPYGHVGIVEKVYPDGTLEISESNPTGNEEFFRGRTTMEDLRKRGLVGFTGGLMSKQGVEKIPTTSGTTQPGMSISGKPLTDTQAKNKTYADMMENAIREFSPIEGRINELSTQAGGLQASWLGMMPNMFKGEEIQKQQQAQYAFGDAYLRYTTGATATPDEIKRAGERFFPQPGDSQSVIEQKKRDREDTAKSIREASGTNSIMQPEKSGLEWLSDDFMQGLMGF